MGRHGTPMTPEQALAIFAYDISDLISRSDGYDGLIPEDRLTQDELIKALPAFFRSLGFDPFAKTADADPEFVRHTCRDGRGPAFGRLAPRGECPRCDQLHDGAPRREAHPAIQAGNRHRDNDARRAREWAEHAASHKHRTGRCNDGLPCTFGDW